MARVTKVLRSGIHNTAEVREGQLCPVTDFPSPDRVEIEIKGPGQPCMMYRYTDADEFCGDTWHQTLADAYAQAQYEYGLSEKDFVTVQEVE